MGMIGRQKMHHKEKTMLTTSYNMVSLVLAQSLLIQSRQSVCWLAFIASAFD